MTLRRNEPEHFTVVAVMRKERKLRRPVVLNTRDRRLGVVRLRYEAELAYLDGRTARAKEWNRKADALAREERETAR
jgi:hypothetical protein